MSLLTRAAFLLRNLTQRTQREADLNEELLGFERLLIEENLRAGMSPEEAKRKARIEIGGVDHVKENVRAARNSAWFEGLWQDIRYGTRSLLRVPAFSATAVIALALGIGASTSIFSVVNGVLLQPLPFRAPSELVTILHEGTDPVAPANFLDWRVQTRSFSTMAAAEAWSPNIAGAGDAERVVGLRVTPAMWPTLGVAPLLGRVFGNETEQVGRDHEVVIGYDMWQQRYAGDSTVLGRTVQLDGDRYTIVGVMPKSFAFAPFWIRDAQMWAALPVLGRNDNRQANSLRIFARLKAGTTLQQARSDVSAVTARLESQFPTTNRDVIVTPLSEQATAGMQRPLYMLLIAVSFLLVAACANVAHMMLARSSSREREMAVRLAIGASTGKLSRQLLCESLLLSLAGGVLGFAIAIVGTKLLVTYAGETIPRAGYVHIDLGALFVTILLSIITGILFGLAPARNAIRTELVSSLKDGGRNDNASSANAGFRHLLVASQFAIALTLLIGAAIMQRTLSAMQNIDGGFDPNGVMTAQVSVKGTPSSVVGSREMFYQRLVETVKQIPGVQAASTINHLPLNGDLWGMGVTIDGAPLSDERKSAANRAVLPGYFRTMGIKLLEGRDIVASDRMNSDPVAVVNEVFAKRHWPGVSAIGKRFAMSGSSSTAPRWITIVGVTHNVVLSNWTDAPAPEIYLPFLQDKQYLENQAGAFSYQTLVVRTRGDVSALAPAIRRAAAALDRGVSVSLVSSMQTIVTTASADRKFYLVALGAFAMVAVVLASVGIYGVMSHNVSKRKHEMGVRIALGASKRELMQLIVGRGMVVVAGGALLGVAGALGLTRLMNTIIYGVQPTDPLTFAVVTLFLLLVAAVSCWIPARRATRVDPLTALRGE